MQADRERAGYRPDTGFGSKHVPQRGNFNGCDMILACADPSKAAADARRNKILRYPAGSVGRRNSQSRDSDDGRLDDDHADRQDPDFALCLSIHVLPTPKAKDRSLAEPVACPGRGYCFTAAWHGRPVGSGRCRPCPWRNVPGKLRFDRPVTGWSPARLAGAVGMPPNCHPAALTVPRSQRPKKNHNRMITGIGTPISQSKSPRPIAAS